MNIDTLSIARDLKATEIPAAQAEAIAAAIGRSVFDAAVSKADLEAAKQELKGDLERLRGQLLIWFIGTQVAVGALIVALVKL